MRVFSLSRLLIRLGIALVLLGAIGAPALYYSLVTTPYENLMKHWIAHIDESAAVLAPVNDEASAKDAAEKLKASNEAFLDLVKKTRAENGDITPGEDARLQEKYGHQLEEAGRKFRSIRERLQGHQPELWKIVGDAAGAVPGTKSPAERMEDDLEKSRTFLPF